MKTCKNPSCKKRFAPQYSSLQKTCGIECAAALAKLEREKDEKQSWTREKKERKEKLMTHGEWENLLEAEIRAIVRLIDAGCNCISCDAKLGGSNQAQAGHRFSVGGYNGLRHNLMNIFLQGVCCNKHQSGNIDGYDEGLMRVYGDAVFQYVKFEMRRNNSVVKLSSSELKEKIQIAKQIVKELKSLNTQYPAAMRIAMRKSYNQRIGIYKD